MRKLKKEDLIEIYNNKELHWTDNQQAARELTRRKIDLKSILLNNILPTEEIKQEQSLYQKFCRNKLNWFLLLILLYTLIETSYFFTLLCIDGLNFNEIGNNPIFIIFLLIEIVFFVGSWIAIDDFERGIKTFRVIGLPLIIIIIAFQEFTLISGYFLEFTKIINFFHWIALTAYPIVYGIIYLPFLKSQGKYFFEIDELKREIEEEKEEEESYFWKIFDFIFRIITFPIVFLLKIFQWTFRKIFGKCIYFYKKLLKKIKSNTQEKWKKTITSFKKQLNNWEFRGKIRRILRKNNNIIKTIFVFLFIIMIISPSILMYTLYFYNSNKDDKGEMFIYDFNLGNPTWLANNSRVKVEKVEFMIFVSKERCRIFHINITHINVSETMYYNDYGKTPLILVDINNFFQTNFFFQIGPGSYSHRDYLILNWSDTISVNIRYNTYKWMNETYRVGININPPNFVISKF